MDGRPADAEPRPPEEIAAAAEAVFKPWILPTGNPFIRDRAVIRADGLDLAFVTVRVLDADGHFAPRAKNRLRFTIDGPGEIVATDNGDPTSFVPFRSPERAAFNGLALVIVRARPGQTGRITLTVSGEGLSESSATARPARANSRTRS